MNILICGGRNFNNHQAMNETFGLIEKYYGQYEVTIISGCAPGADTLAIEYAERYNCNVKKFPANWSLHGKSAGPKRNQQMIDEGNPRLAIAFEGGAGTKDMVDRCRKNNIPIIMVKTTVFFDLPFEGLPFY